MGPSDTIGRFGFGLRPVSTVASGAAMGASAGATATANTGSEGASNATSYFRRRAVPTDRPRPSVVTFVALLAIEEPDLARELLSSEHKRAVRSRRDHYGQVAKPFQVEGLAAKIDEMLS